MGSFNTSCFASHQTIAPGETCFVLPISQRQSFETVEVTQDGQASAEWGLTDSICYPNGFWKPMTGFIEAKYDDYGRVKVVRTPRNGVLLLHLFTCLLKNAGVVKQGKNQFHDVPYDLPNFIKESTPRVHGLLNEQQKLSTEDSEREALFAELESIWNYTWEAAQEHRLFVKRSYAGLRPAQFAILHGESYHRLFEITSSCKTWDKASMEPRSYLEALLTKVKADMASFIAEEVEDFKSKYDPNSAKPLSEELAQLERSLSHLTVSRFFDEFSHVASFEQGLSPIEHAALRPSVRRHLTNELSFDELYEKALPFMKDRYVLSALQYLNLYITPLVYAGQDYSNHLGTAYTRFVQHVSQAVNRGRNREEDEEETESDE